MSGSEKEGERAAVFRTTKVRTKLKGDGSWLQRNNEPQTQTTEKPWLAEVRAGRLNGAPIETSPVSSPTKPAVSPTKPNTERAPTSGYLIRGVFTKLDDKPTSSSTSNGISKTTQFNKKPSEGYKRIAPHTVRSALENNDEQLSQEEKDKRTEAASSVLKKSAVRQRSYVFSAAKKYESKENPPDAVTPSFVAKRVEILDDDGDDDDVESAPTPAPASSPPPSPVAPVTSVASAPQPRSGKIGDTAVKTASNEPVTPPKVEEAAPKPAEEEPAPEPDPFEDMTPGCTKVATPLPELAPVYVEAVCADPELEDGSDDSGPADAPLVPLTPASPVTTTVKTEPEPEPEPKLSPNPSSNVDTHAALYGTLISFDTSSTSSDADEPELAKQVDSHTTENGVEEEPASALSNSEPATEDLLALNDGPEESAVPVPPSPGRWSQDLLSGLDSEAEPAKASSALDLLADDVIPINTETESLSTRREEEKQTDETAKATQSPTEAVTTTTKTVIITEKSSADPFDPYPIGTTSPNSSSDLLQPLADISINSASTPSLENEDPSPEENMSSNALDSLAEGVIPIDTNTTRLRTKRSWALTWDIDTPEESEEPEPEGQTKDQETLIMFEKKPAENDSPWKRWTLPTGDEEEEEEEEETEEEKEGESPENTQTQTDKTVTTIKETHSEPEPAMDRAPSKTVMEEARPVETPEPETKKGFVYVKEYVNTADLALHNSTYPCSEPDSLTPSSTSYPYSSPSTYSSDSLSSNCTYCGEPVGNDAKITIEHLNINCHPDCFKCGVCSKPMGDLIDSMYLHGDKVHCESCYSKVFD